MVTVIRQQRKPPILTPSAIPCLNRVATLNITRGCALGCTYCYIRGYSYYPGEDRIILYENTPDVLRAELSRKRRPPRRVYFCPSSDAFQYPPEVQEVSFRTMSLLLEHGIEIAFLTKGFLTERFVRLFAGKPRSVFAQVGITTMDRRLWKMFEPRTAPPEMRIAAIRALTEIGVATTVRLDPLLPDLTDMQSNLEPLLACLREASVTRAAASYLFLRSSFARKVLEQIRQNGVASLSSRSWRHQRFLDGFASARTLARDRRAARFSRIAALAERFGISITACQCKNPDLNGAPCHVAGPPHPAGASVQGLF